MTSSSDPSEHHFVFVGGVPRSGTTLFTRCLGDHSEVSVLRDTPAVHDEGHHLTGAIPSGIGEVGDFALRPGTVLTRADASPDRTSRIWRDWSPYWDTSRRVLVEKTPANLIRLDFLRASFPRTTLVVLVRHPVPTVVAQEKMSGAPERVRLRNWLRCHELMERHARGLEVLVVPYGRFVDDPDRELERVYRSVGVEPRPCGRRVERGIDAEYWERWWSRADGRRRLVQRALLTPLLEPRVRRFGFSLLDLAHFDDAWCDSWRAA